MPSDTCYSCSDKIRKGNIIQTVLTVYFRGFSSSSDITMNLFIWKQTWFQIKHWIWNKQSFLRLIKAAVFHHSFRAATNGYRLLKLLLFYVPIVDVRHRRCLFVLHPFRFASLMNGNYCLFHLKSADFTCITSLLKTVFSLCLFIVLLSFGCILNEVWMKAKAKVNRSQHKVSEYD